MTAAICPDCRADRHYDCDSTAWCDAISFPSACDCWKADHNPEGLA